MIEQNNKPKEEAFYIIRHLEENPAATQRTVSDKLGISLGKTNYLIKELIKKGFIEAQNFTYNSGKLQKVQYLLTKAGLEEKWRLANYFMQIKEAEYNVMKQELSKQHNNKVI
ncbi:MAG: MarR family EPS-associated transcriptional regulator [Candidatus Omnitrophica bacterium]|nr:MarR family EPS-associated transcriptional regulator [Candidatus Omnitrophota bacterium]